MKKFGKIFLITLLIVPLLYVVSTAGKKKQEERCLKCHPKYYKRFADKKKFIHKPFKEKKCDNCHQFHGFRNQIEFKDTIVNLCTKCHNILDDLADDNLHSPILDEESCISCHTPHASDYKNLLISPKNTICLECHDDPAEAVGTKHVPYAEGNCLKCHTPHGSLFGALFQMPIGYMCLECHDNIITDFPPDNMHTADDVNSCNNCHDGHSSEHSSLLNYNSIDLCLSCHEDLKEKVTGTDKHSVFEDESCTICHNPHFQKEKQNLVEETPSLCFNCHPDIEEKINLEFPHAAVDDGCMTCHDPHGGVFVEPQPDLCTNCHDTDDTDFQNKHAGKTNMQKCSFCHNPHGADNENLLLSK